MQKAKKDKIDLIINAGTLLTMDIDDLVLHNKSILISQGNISDIIDISESEQLYPDIKTISAEKKIVMPGFVNTHTHIAMSYFKGLADDLPLEKWLNDFIWPAEHRCINPDFVYEASLHGISEMIKNGVTFFNDMYFIPTETARACQKLGARAVLGVIALDFAMGNFHHPESSLHNVAETMDAHRNNPLIDFSMSVHSVYTCSERTWQNSITCARQNGMLLHTHLSETAIEVENCIKQYNKTPVELAHSLGAFDNKMIFAHGVHLTDNDFQLIKKSGCSVSMNLHSNLKLASGIMPIKKYLHHDINLSIGTDGAASNNTLSISDEISTAGKLFKAVYKDASFLSARELVRMATINGAKALGKGDVTGSIEVGKAADIICINVDNFQCQPIYDPFSYLVYSMNRQNISSVVINGKLILDDRVLQTIDEEELLDNVYKNMLVVR